MRRGCGACCLPACGLGSKTCGYWKWCRRTKTRTLADLGVKMARSKDVRFAVRVIGGGGVVLGGGETNAWHAGGAGG